MSLRLAAHGDAANDLEPRRVFRNDDHRHSLVRLGVRVGHHHGDQERGLPGVGREPLLAVDHPLVAVANGARLEEHRISARMRLGHRVAGTDLTIEERLQVAFLQRLCAVAGEDFRVAGVGRLTAEDRRCEAGAPEDFVHEAELQLAIPLAAEVGSEVTGPQAAVLHLPLERANDRHRGPIGLVVRIVEDVVERLDFLADERVHPIELLLEPGVSFEIPSHLLPPFLVLDGVVRVSLFACFHPYDSFRALLTYFPIVHPCRKPRRRPGAQRFTARGRVPRPMASMRSGSMRSELTSLRLYRPTLGLPLA